MRIFITLLSFFFITQNLQAQILEVAPLDSNKELQRVNALVEKEKMAEFVRLAGTPDYNAITARTHDCVNLDGSYTCLLYTSPSPRDS